MKVDIYKLLDRFESIKNFALGQNVTPSYIYKLVKEGKMELVEIGGIYFVDTVKFPVIPVANRRK